MTRALLTTLFIANSFRIMGINGHRQTQRSPYTGIKGTHPDTYRDVHISQTQIAPYMGINAHTDGHKWTQANRWPKRVL